ncbi:MAG TPA: c-type cytochrome [Sphingomicrobium sp.]|nr:c-type cytochrome [Sphingomicrobium sp.]
MNREKLLLASGCAALLAAVATAQTTPAPGPLAPPYKNLQIFPKDIAQADLVNNMKFFAQSLGVRCSHCHVGVEGQPLSTFDFASDAKVQKQTARAMLRMVHRINGEDFGVKEFKDVKVTCYTCHRGSAKPLTAPPPALAQPAPTERGNN